MTRMLICLALSAPSKDEMEWDEANAKIPIEYAAQRKGEIRQLSLYVSTDRGATWSRYAVAQTGQSHFQFTAKKSGPHWFVLVIEEQNGDVNPKDVTMADPGLKMFVRVDKKPK